MKSGGSYNSNLTVNGNSEIAARERQEKIMIVLVTTRRQFMRAFTYTSVHADVN